MFILIFVLILIALIIVHEFGHFIVAKFFKIRVDEFGIFFPPRLFAKKFGETEYSINLLPLGGFVKIFGENYDEGKNDPRSFVSKPRYQQALVIVAGIAFNLIFAWLVISAGYMAGLPTAAEHKGFGTVTNQEATVTGLRADSPAQKAGIMPGDSVKRVETATDSIDTKVLNSQQSTAITAFITSHSEESVVITVERNNEEKIFLAKAAEGLVPDRKVIGIELADIGILKLNPIQALGQGAILTWDITKSTAVGLAGFFKQIFTASANFNEVAGPIGITVYGASAIKEGFAAAAVLTALISINLAIINLVPIPGLDGGRLFIIIIESIIRRPVSPAVVMKLTIAGFLLLITLMIVVSYHDIARLVG